MIKSSIQTLCRLSETNWNVTLPLTSLWSSNTFGVRSHLDVSKSCPKMMGCPLLRHNHQLCETFVKKKPFSFKTFIERAMGRQTVLIFWVSKGSLASNTTCNKYVYFNLRTLFIFIIVVVPSVISLKTCLLTITSQQTRKLFTTSFPQMRAKIYKKAIGYLKNITSAAKK